MREEGIAPTLRIYIQRLGEMNDLSNIPVMNSVAQSRNPEFGFQVNYGKFSLTPVC